MFKNKRILLGVTASIAAYKIIFLVRLLKKEGAEVKVILTAAAHDFVTPLSLSTLSENPVYSDFMVDEQTGEWTNHVELGLWADVMLVAPATANTLSKMVSGESDNFLLATYLSAKCPVLVAPAMDLDMFKHPSTISNLRELKTYGNEIIEPGTGELASGLNGKGRMAEPEQLVEAIRSALFPNNVLTGKRILITAGPTYEAIDPVRFIGNRSTGTMGFRIAEAAAKLGAKVTLVLGLESAQEMYEACLQRFEETDVVVMAAAVADYTPIEKSNQKIKKAEGDMQIALKRTKDILASLGKQKTHQLLVGFALETQNGLANAISKLERKNLDFIVLNSLEDKGAGFGKETNKITLIDRNNNIRNFELKSKEQVAHDILNVLMSYYEAH